MKYDGVHCPKCGKKVKRKGKNVKCGKCGWSYVEEMDLWEKQMFEAVDYFYGG